MSFVCVSVCGSVDFKDVLRSYTEAGKSSIVSSRFETACRAHFITSIAMSRSSPLPPPRPFYEEKVLPDPIWAGTTHNIQDSTLTAIDLHDGIVVVVLAETGTDAGTYAKILANRLATMAASNGRLTTCLSVTGSEAHGRDLVARLTNLQCTPDHLTIVIGNDVHTVAPYQAFLDGILASHVSTR